MLSILAYLTHLPKSLAFSVLGGLTGPLINRKAIQANFLTADAQQMEALYEYDKTLLTAYAEVCTLMSKIDNLDQYYQLKAEESTEARPFHRRSTTTVYEQSLHLSRRA
jgi:outer membrane protein TolC